MRTSRDYWEERYRKENTGWDIGQISPPLKSYIDQLKDKTIKILIPGGGNAYEAEYLFSLGFHNIFVNDITELPLKNLKERIPSFPDSNLILKDFFDIDQKFNLIIEQTFFSAIPVTRRMDYVEKMHELLIPRGKLTGLLFNKQFDKEGPPFGGDREEYLSLFSEKFHIKTLENCYNSIDPRLGNELFFIFIQK